MKLYVVVLIVALTVALRLPAQEPAEIFTRPDVPDREALERLNLKMAWRVYVPTAGRRDGFHSVVLLGNQVLVLTRAGLVSSYDLRTGEAQWRKQLDLPFDITQPLQAEGQFVFITSRAKRHVLRRDTGLPPPPGEPIPIPFAGLVGVGEEPVAWHGDMVYTVRTDQSLTAESLSAGFLLWRISLAGRATRQPYITNDDVFYAIEGSGLFRTDRVTGEPLWRSEKATRFLAANPKFVYATDRSGRLLVLDYKRGTRLSVFDNTRDFVFPIGNEVTDRVFLASHDGLLVCLHDREYPEPLRNKTVEGTPGAAKPKADDKKPPPEKQPEKTPSKDGDKVMPEKP